MRDPASKAQKTLWRVLERDTRLPSSVSHDSNQNSGEKLPSEAKYSECKAEKEETTGRKALPHRVSTFGNVFSKLSRGPSPRLALIGTDKGIRESKSGRLWPWEAAPGCQRRRWEIILGNSCQKVGRNLRWEAPTAFYFQNSSVKGHQKNRVLFPALTAKVRQIRMSRPRKWL